MSKLAGGARAPAGLSEEALHSAMRLAGVAPAALLAAVAGGAVAYLVEPPKNGFWALVLGAILPGEAPLLQGLRSLLSASPAAGDLRPSRAYWAAAGILFLACAAGFFLAERFRRRSMPRPDVEAAPPQGAGEIDR